MITVNLRADNQIRNSVVGQFEILFLSASVLAYGLGMAKSKTKKPAKRKARLDASQNALRIVEQAIGGKLVETKRRVR
jgi:hypothetical protein